MKKCSTCKKEKREEDFYKNKAVADGLTYKCKSCYKEYNKQYNASHRQVINARQRVYNLMYQDDRREYFKKRYQEKKLKALQKKQL